MNKKKLKNLVKKAKGELSWLVLEEAQPSGPMRIFSDPTVRTHTIFQPSSSADADPARELRALHELGHALLCERVHPFFSTGFPIDGLNKDLVPAAVPVLSTASDWFVGQWMMEFCHDVAIAQLKAEFEATSELMESGETPSVDKFFVAVLIIARAMKYLGTKVECSGFLDSAVQAFLSIPPERPSVWKMEELINRLLSLGSPYRCRHLNSEGQDVMEFYRFSEEPLTSHGGSEAETA
jgi:hypothetical protein